MRGILKKLAYLIPVIFAVTLLSFLLVKALPGDPTINKLGFNATPDAIKELHHNLGLDKPLAEQYGIWLGHLTTGNLGRSYISNQPVMQTIKQNLPTTIELMILAQLIALALAIPAAIYAAYRPNGMVDRVSTSISFGMLALPAFIFGVFLVY